MTPADDHRFWSKVQRFASNECWIWMGAVTGKGYGNFSYQGKSIGAHRYAKASADGIEIPDWHIWEIDHTCQNKLCQNPAHLDWVARAGRINSVRHQERRFGDRTTCVNGHPWIEANIYRRDYGAKHYKACRLCRTAAASRSHARSTT